MFSQGSPLLAVLASLLPTNELNIPLPSFSERVFSPFHPSFVPTVKLSHSAYSSSIHCNSCEPRKSTFVVRSPDNSTVSPLVTLRKPVSHGHGLYFQNIFFVLALGVTRSPPCWLRRQFSSPKCEYSAREFSRKRWLGLPSPWNPLFFRKDEVLTTCHVPSARHRRETYLVAGHYFFPFDFVVRIRPHWVATFSATQFSACVTQTLSWHSRAFLGQHARFFFRNMHLALFSHQCALRSLYFFPNLNFCSFLHAKWNTCVAWII